MGEVTHAAADMLAARLLWPSPRVRWETARGIARLVSSGDTTARTSLLDWIEARTLESEVTLGLGVIDGFGLGRAFEAAELSDRIRVPSLLSDWLMARIFGEDAVSSAGHLDYAPDSVVELPAAVDRCFERYRRFAVPPIFELTLRTLEKSTGAPLTERWRHEWRWLQALHDRPISGDPDHFFSPSVKGEVGSYDGAQREVFASAFLRTLHWARGELGAPREALESHALLVLTTNPGLAQLEPRPRKPWSRLVLPPTSQWQDEARKAWTSAEKSVLSSERPIALNAFETDRTSFVEYRIRLVAVAVGSTLSDERPLSYKGIVLDEEPHAFAGLAARNAAFASVKIDAPILLFQTLSPRYWGRLHVDLASEIGILSPLLVGRPIEIEGRSDEIVGMAGGLVVTRWHHWLAGWSPAQPADMLTSVPSLTTARRDVLRRLAKERELRFALWAHTRRGTRRDSYATMEVSEETAWLEDDV